MSAVHARIESLLQQHPVVLFMKGSPQAPRCGFSAAAAGVLNELLPEYASVDVLEDAEIREGIKAYGTWPTIPQLYVKGELIGGADIVQSMYNSGELQKLFGLPEPDRTPPSITISDAAAEAIRAALADAGPDTALQLAIDPRFQAQFQLAEPAAASATFDQISWPSPTRHRFEARRTASSSRWTRRLRRARAVSASTGRRPHRAKAWRSTPRTRRRR